MKKIFKSIKDFVQHVQSYWTHYNVLTIAKKSPIFDSEWKTVVCHIRKDGEELIVNELVVLQGVRKAA